MTKINSSPERNTFQLEGYLKRCEIDGDEPNEAYIDLFKSAKQRDIDNMNDPAWQVDNMEYDLRSTDWICEKVKQDNYAQNLYAAMCNNDFMKNDVWPILTEKTWSCSWRHAGGIIADMRQEGDYIDWYCSGINGDGPGGLGNNDEDGTKGYLPEGYISDEIREDLLRLGWLVVNTDEGD